MNTMPHAVASIVKFNGKQYLIQEINLTDLDYSLIGHKELKSFGYGEAWVDHEEVELIENPTQKSWKMLVKSYNYKED